MLRQLYIDNVAVIERAEIALGDGLTVLTGETGAGKSILIDALSVVLGERASRDLIRTGCPFATVTAVFDDLSESVLALLEQQGLSHEDDGTLLLRRRISAENKSQCFVGSQPCTAATMRELGRMLVNIHGQHENQALLSVDRHLEYLDRLGDLKEEPARYKECYRRYCATHRALNKQLRAREEAAQREDMLRFQAEEIESASLIAGEEETLASRREILHNAEKIGRWLRMSERIFDGDEQENGALGALEQAMMLLRDAGKFMPQAQELSERLGAVLPELQDVAANTSVLSGAKDFDPGELDAVEERLALVRRLCDKYGGTTEAVIAFGNQVRAALNGLEQAQDSIEALSAQLENEQQQLVEAAAALTSARRKAAERFSTAVCEQLRFLDMPRVTLSVSIEPTSMTATGADKVEFLLSANPGEPPKSIAKVASGGELSRIMLAMKSVMASADEIPTLIFDEIDVGISGHAAAKVGYRLRRLGATEGKQVLCVTHLAQIAACAHHQLLIEKQVTGESTFTQVHALTGNERAKELARIIGGEVTPLSLQTAEDMLVRFPSLADESDFL
ncbi:MAG: DNA repair protein RecN [Clostridia bacterium]|nr:DNA repair protein RecN [Clostridia bacterium]